MRSEASGAGGVEPAKDTTCQVWSLRPEVGSGEVLQPGRDLSALDPFGRGKGSGLEARQPPVWPAPSLRQPGLQGPRGTLPADPLPSLLPASPLPLV